MAELALVLPLLLVLLLSMLDFGKAFNAWIDETHLANLGARLAAVQYPVAGCTGNPNVCLAQYVQAGADLTELRSGRTGDSYAPQQSPAKVCISYPNNPATNTFGLVGDPVRVTVSVDYKWLTYLSARIGLGTTPITGGATMRLEQNPSDKTGGCYP